MEAGDVIKCGNVSIALVISDDGKLKKIWLPEFKVCPNTWRGNSEGEVLFNLQDIFRDLATEEYKK